MRAGDVVGEYVRIVRNLDRLVPGSLDSYGLPPLDPAAPEMTAGDVVRAAGRLARVVPDTLEPVRAGFLRGQLVACEWTARRLVGQAVPFVDEIRALFGVGIAIGSEDVYRAAHRDLGDLLPGRGPLAERIAAHRGGEEIPPARLEAAVRALSTALRARTTELVPLPAADRVDYRVVADAPWTALHHYRGGYASTVTVNAGARLRCSQLAQLVAHEVYPGHHTERCRKEAGLVAAGWDEHRAVVANTPQSLVAEGAAEMGLLAVAGRGWGPWAAGVLGEVGLVFDGELAERVDALTSVLARARQDAALLLHGYRASDDEVRMYLRRWLLVDDARATAMLRFLRHRVWRSYTTTYVEGPALVRSWLGSGEPAGRLLRLLDEPLTPWGLRAGSAQVPAA